MINQPKLSPSSVVLVSPHQNVVDFQKTRLKAHVYPFQDSIRGLCSVLAEIIGCDLFSLEALNLESDTELSSSTYCVFDTTDLKSRWYKGTLRATWSPFIVFAASTRLLTLHARYSIEGAYVSGITLNMNGQDTRTSCSNMSAAYRVCASYLRSLLDE